MKVSSAKQKGRRFQQDVRDKLLEVSNGLEPDDIRSASMGAYGEDILFSPAARRQFPFSIECKNVEKLSIWRCIDQARANAPAGTTPIVAFTRNREVPHLAIPMNEFLRIYEVYLRHKEIHHAYDVVVAENQDLLEKLND